MVNVLERAPHLLCQRRRVSRAGKINGVEWKDEKSNMQKAWEQKHTERNEE